VEETKSEKSKFQFLLDPNKLAFFKINGRAPDRKSYERTLSQKLNDQNEKTIALYKELSQKNRIFKEDDLPDLYLEETETIEDDQEDDHSDSDEE